MSICPFCHKNSSDYIPEIRCKYQYHKGEDKGKFCNSIIKSKLGKNITTPLCGQHLHDVLKGKKIKVSEFRQHFYLVDSACSGKNEI